MKRGYDSTVARIAGNIAPGLIARGTCDGDPLGLAKAAVELARLIVALVEDTDPDRTASAAPGDVAGDDERAVGVPADG
jgi:hypothetical protein